MMSATDDEKQQEEPLVLADVKLNEDHDDKEENASLLDGKALEDDSTNDFSKESTKNSIHEHHIGFSFNIRVIGIVVLVLLSVSHVLLLRQCIMGLMKQAFSPPIVRKYRVNTNYTTLTIHTTPRRSASSVGEVDPGQIVEIFERDDSKDFHRILEPYLGFVQKDSPHSGLPYFVPLDEDVSSFSICPLIYEGWWPDGESLQKYLYAPTCLVVAQQLWNGMQVLVLYLLISLNYCQSTSQQDDMYMFWNDKMNAPSVHMAFKWGTRLFTVVMVAILPFSVYIVSPGGHIFASLTLMLALSGILFTPRPVLSLSLGEDRSSAMGDTSSPLWTLGWEETLGFLCCLGSSLYNYVGLRTWPKWRTQFYKIDDYFGWKDWGDVMVEGDFTLLGLFHVRLPIFVTRGSGGTTFGGQVFVLVWSFLPFLYVSYFTCLYALSRKSPGVFIQRALCLFGICHFLFFTDVVAYRYGRGYRNPHEEFFHWTEKWSWRIAVLLPIYQNCTNGHWEHGNKRFPILGKLLRWALIGWGVWFLVFQVINSDIVLTYEYFRDLPKANLIDTLGLDDTPVFRRFHYPYFRALVMMWMMYGLLSLSALSTYGFTLFRIFLRRGIVTIGSSENRTDDMQLDLLENNELEGWWTGSRKSASESMHPFL